MSFQNSKYIKLASKKSKVFQGGLVDNIESDQLQFQNSPFARNFRIDGKGIRIRPGFTIFGDEFDGVGERPFGIEGYERATASDNRVIIGYKQSLTQYLLSIDSDGTQTPITIGAFAFLIGGSSAESDIAQWNTIDDGEFAMTIDGTPREFTNLRFIGETRISYISPGQDQTINTFGVNWRGQTFTTIGGFDIQKVNLKLAKNNNPVGTFTVAIRATAAGLPTGADLISTSFDYSAVTSTPAFFEVDFGSTVTLSATTQYAIVMSYSLPDAGNSITPVRNNDGTDRYTGGTYVTSGDSGASWSADATRDFYFEVIDDSGLVDVTSMDEVASTLQTDIRAVTSGLETVVWSTDHFIISSGEVGATGAITVTSTVAAPAGTDISGAGASDWLDCDTGNGTVTNQVTFKVTVEDRMNFINFKDFLYCMNGTDLYGRLSGTTYTTPSTGIGSFAPSFAVEFNSAVWASGWVTNATLLYQSNTDDGEDFSTGTADQHTFGEPITGLSSNNQTLYIFTRNQVHMMNNSSIRDVGGTLTYSSVQLQTKEGAVNHNSIANIGRNTYFLTKSNKIKKISAEIGGGYDTVDLSHRKYNGIDKTMALLDSDQTDSFAYEDTENNLIKWHLKTIGSTVNDLCIIYNVELDQFMVDNQKIFFGGVFFDKKSYTISHLEDKVYQDEFGQTDDDSAIQFEYQVKLLDFGLPTMQKEIWQARSFLAINELAELDQSIQADGGQIDIVRIDKDDIPISGQGIGTKAIGTYAIGTAGFEGKAPLQNICVVREKGNLQVRANNFQFIFKCSSLGAQVLIQDLQPRIEVLDQLVASCN